MTTCIAYRIGLAVFIFPVLVFAADQLPRSLSRSAVEKPAYRTSQALVLARDIHVNASLSELRNRLPVILQEIARSGSRDEKAVYDAVAVLGRQPRAVEALAAIYRDQSSQQIMQRLLVVQVVGQMRRADAIPFLEEVIWKPLHAGTRIDGVLSAREWEEVIQVKAIHGLAFLRSQSAFDRTIKVAREHESDFVRREAIDAWLWNHHDNPDAVGELKKLLPERDHAYIGIPRFVHGMDAAAFNKRVQLQKSEGAKP